MNAPYRDKLLYLSRLIGRRAPALGRELEGVTLSYGRIEEIRIRRHGSSQVQTAERGITLRERYKEPLEELLSDALSGSPFSQRESIACGYITMECGVRVGVIGRASYDGSLVGIRDISALVFRIPSHGCPLSEDMYRRWVEGGERGALIISPPGGGKSTALFSLVGKIAEKRHLRTVLVDERCECDSRALEELGVDVMRGYRRARGLEIAVRTMSAEIVACDEIYTPEDVAAVMSAHGTGVRIIASAHAKDEGELRKRAILSEALQSGVFETLFTVERRDGDFSFSVSRLC